MLQLVKFVRIHQNERNKKAANVFQKQHLFAVSDVEEKYLSLLTHYASDFVLQQINKMQYIKLLKKTEDNTYNVMSASTGDVKYTVTHNSCNCTDYNSMGLPCRHLLKVRSIKKLNLFDEYLCKERWTKQYFLKHHRSLKTQVNNNSLEADNSGQSSASIISNTSNRLCNIKQKLQLKTANKNISASVTSGTLHQLQCKEFKRNSTDIVFRLPYSEAKELSTSTSLNNIVKNMLVETEASNKSFLLAYTQSYQLHTQIAYTSNPNKNTQEFQMGRLKNNEVDKVYAKSNIVSKNYKLQLELQLEIHLQL